MQPRGLKRSRSCRLKCSETAAGQELASLSASARQLPPLASGGVTFTGPHGRRFLKDARQIESRFVITAAALARPRGGYATLIRGRHRANRISVIRGSVRAARLSLISPKKTGQQTRHRLWITAAWRCNAAPSEESRRIKRAASGDQSALFTAAVGTMRSRFLPD